MYFFDSRFLGNPALGISLMMTEFCGCRVKGETPIRHFEPRDPEDGLVLYKNVHIPQRLFASSGRLIVCDDLFQKLQSRCQVRGIAVKELISYNVPYGIGIDDFECDKAYTSSDSCEQAVWKFARRFACAPPATTYYELVTPSIVDRIDLPDLRQRRLKSATDDYESVDESWLSERFADEVGLYSTFGYVCADRVFELLRPELPDAWYWHTKL